MTLTMGSRIQFLRTIIAEGGSSCRQPMIWIIVLTIFSAVAFGAAPFFLSRWVSMLAESPADIAWVRGFSLYLLAYTLAFASRDVQWWLYARIESTVLSAVTRKLTWHSIHTSVTSNGVGLLSQTLQGAQSLLFCSFFILIPAVLETASMLTAIIGTTPLWMAFPLLLHTFGFLFLIDFGTRRVAHHQIRLNPFAARVLDLVGALFSERPLLQRYPALHLSERILALPIQQREAERLRMGWTRTWTTTLLNLWALIGLTANLGLALWFHTNGTMTLGEVVAVESIFFLVLRRLEMWSRGYRETQLAMEQCRDGLALMATNHDMMVPSPSRDVFTNGACNVLSGRTGTGKSTWLLNRWKRNSCKPGFLPQRPEILPGSIRFNLTLGEQTVEAAMSATLRELDLDRVISRLPDGLDTELFPGQPSPLSGGELQRLCLARVLLHWKSDELLLDEPTSAQSIEEESRTLQALQQFTQGKTVWIVSHRPEAIHGVKRFWECTGWDRVEERMQ